jgi:hypothetical protein
VGTAKIGESDVAVSASTGDALKAAYFAVAWPPVALTNELAIARSAKPQISLRTEPAQLVFGKDLSATVKVIATRDMGFDEAITLAVTPAQGGLPAGVTAAVKPIVKGQNEIEVVFTATAQAPLGDFTAVLTGTIKQGNVTVVQPTPGIGLKLDEPLKLTAAAGDGKLKKGGQLTVKVALQRNPAAPGEVDLVLQNLPKGVTAPATKVPADKNEVDLVLSAAADAQVGAVNNVSVKGDVTVGKAKLSGVSPNLTLTVE